MRLDHSPSVPLVQIFMNHRQPILVSFE